MNDKIAKIAAEALDRAVSETYTFLSQDQLTRFTDEFARRIIRECADICNKIYFERYPDAEDFERSEEGDAIKQHFGVEK